MPTVLRLLILEDDAFDADLEVATLEDAGYVCQWERVETRAEFLACLDAPDYDVILADYSLSAFDGLTALQLFLDRDLDLPFIFVSGSIGEETAIESLKAGATDYVLKDHLTRLGLVVKRALREGEERQQRRQAEEALQKNQQLLNAILDNTPVAIHVKDLDGRYLLVNRQIEKQFGWRRREAVGKTPREVYPPELADRFLAADRDALEAGTAMQFEEFVPLADGMHTFLATKFPLVDADGVPYAIAGISADITERKRAEEELRIKDHAVACSINAIAISDLQGNITYVNPAFLAMWGYDDEDDVLGRSALEFWQQPAEAAKVMRLVQEEEGRVGELVGIRRDGSVFDAQFFATLVTDEEGRPLCMMASFADITERLRAEEELQRHAVELEQANTEIKQFAYIVSHDLRAPLVNLKGFAAELRAALAVIGSATIESLPHLGEKQQRNVTLALEEDVPEALEFIDASVSRMDAFINAMLRLSRLGRRELRPETIDTQALVQANLETLAHQIEEGGVRVTVGPLPQVVADRTAMEQIWGNLLGNAVKYLDPDRPGEIEITAESADVAPDRLRSATTFHVRDNGRGIAADDMDKVFALFRRAGRQDVPGEGMGLAYVQTLVRRHGGRIWCESEPGVGSTFSFTVPSHGADGDPLRGE